MQTDPLPRTVRLLHVAGFLFAVFFIWHPEAIALAQEGQEEFFIHEFHASAMGLDCSVCHQPFEEGSVELARPGHDQCLICHQDSFETDINPLICNQCHSAFPPTSSEELLPYPRFKGSRPLLVEFAHAHHVDPRARVDSRTGFRADCTHCHKFEEDGVHATIPSHTECASCHSKEGMTPSLTPASDTPDCRNCHNPEQIENPEFNSGTQNLVAAHDTLGLNFSHQIHFRNKDKFALDCTTCHSTVPSSANLADLTRPEMLDCVPCHQAGRGLAADLQMSNCSSCHVGVESGPLPASHNADIKPPSHNESFRKNHSEAAGEQAADCYACHDVAPQTKTDPDSCISCHQVMLPTSHTARWRDNVHGKMAALDRDTCATCHIADQCASCHNQVPRSHEPLSLFRAGAHGNLAMLDQRSCMTCHTQEDTCAQCHVTDLRPPE